MTIYFKFNNTFKTHQLLKNVVAYIPKEIKTML